MDPVDQAAQTQLNNIQTRTGKSLDDLYALLSDSGLKKHGEMRDFLIQKLELGYGDANLVAHMYRAKTEEQPAPLDDPLDLYYTGKNAALRPIHEKIMEEIEKFGDFEISPKKKNLSLRRSRQFAILGPGTKGRMEVGLNMKGVEGTDRLLAQPPGGMCQYKVFLSDINEVDEDLIGWIRQAYDAAG